MLPLCRRKPTKGEPVSDRKTVSIKGVDDWNDMLWILAHREAQIYMNDDKWYVLVNNPCSFYDPARGCLIYPKRPRICREHTWKDCEYKEDYNFDLHFHSYEELERFIRNNVVEE
ncbi:MAG: YkgJ family cysteine cluster protein [Candidatus Krumholzibacteria bacterium]|nr:YkgJ family cysteine cluster protein [Candidatus Krumholzibacteria bacterium]